MRGSSTDDVVDTLHPVTQHGTERITIEPGIVRGSPTYVVNTLQQVAHNGNQRDKSGQITSPQTLKGICTKRVRCSNNVKKVRFSHNVKKVRFSDNVKRVRFFYSGAVETVEDLSIRPTAVAVAKRGKIAEKKSPVLSEGSKAMRRQRRKTQSALTLAPQAAHTCDPSN